MLHIVVGIAAAYVFVVLYQQSSKPAPTPTIQASNPFTVTYNQLAIQNQIVDKKDTIDPMTNLPAELITYSNGYTEMRHKINGETPERRMI